MFDIDLEMEAGDDGPPDEFPEGASPAALQRILRKLSAGLDDLLSPQGRYQRESSLPLQQKQLRVCRVDRAGHPRMKQLLADLKADGDDERQV